MTEAIRKVGTEQVQVTERLLLPGESAGHHIHEYDYVVVPLTGGELTIVDSEGNSTKFPTEMGGARARQKGVAHNVFNLSDQEIRFTEIEFLG